MTEHMALYEEPSDDACAYGDRPVACRCGFDPWEENMTDGSGPDDDLVYESMYHHLLANDGVFSERIARWAWRHACLLHRHCAGLDIASVES